jgi:glycosyltransferase involved in cell wall biosynthesis
MATYNRASMLHASIDSLLAQSRPVDEIIIVDDGSTDDTEQIIRSYGPRLTYLRQENAGRSSAINLGLAHCKSDYVWTFDDDDIAQPDGHENLAAVLDADQSIDFAFGAFHSFREDPSGRRHINDNHYWLRPEEPSIRINFLEGMFTQFNAMLVRRSLYEKVGGFRKDLLRSQDVEMALRLARNARAAPVDKVIFLYRIHDGLRGSVGHFFPAEESAKRWFINNRHIYSIIRKEFELDEFTPTFAQAWDKPLARRAALLERACVFALRSMWDETLDDLRAAAIAAPAAAATPEEMKLAEIAIRIRDPWKELGKNLAWIAQLNFFYKTNDYSRSIIYSLCRPLVWQMRHSLQGGKFHAFLELTKVLTGILGTRDGASRLLSSLFD